MKQYVVTISREFGSRGAEIGKNLAEELGIHYYDRDLVNEAARKMKIGEEELFEMDENLSERKINLDFNFEMNQIYLSDKLIQVQSDIIKNLAEKESCVIVGRCANYVLRNKENCLNVLIYAPYKKRVSHILNTHPDFNEHKAKNFVDKMDRKRNQYYNYVTGKDRKQHFEHQLMCDSSLFGIEGTVQILKKAVEYL